MMQNNVSIIAGEIPKQAQDACCPPQQVITMPDVAEDTAEMFKAIGHPIRLQMLLLLAQSEESVCVCDIERPFTIKQPTVSHHLRVLRESGLVDTEQRGTWVYYRIRPQAIRVLQGILACLTR